MPIRPVYELTVYEEDDTTARFVVSTDPAHANPYLKPPTSFAAQEVDFANGAASIGQINVQIVDKRTTPTDQATGFLTALLANSDGHSQINGYRAVLTEDSGAGAVVLLDGVVRSARLLDSFVTYDLELRDIRERERKIRAFETTDTPTVLPRGVMDGFGVQNGAQYSGVPPTQPLTGFYRLDAANRGEIEINDDSTREPEQVLTAPMREALESVAPLAGSPQVIVHDRWKLLWRDKAAGGAYTVVEQIAHQHPDLPGGGGRLPYTAGERLIGGVRINNVISGDTLPSNGQEVEFIVRYDGPVTEDWNYHLQGLTVGELLRNGYRGDYSTDAPRIRYNETALLALNTPARAKIRAPVEDFRSWAEQHAYPIAHAAPTLNAAGEIAPITYLLPDASETLVDLDDANCRPVGGGWSHGSEEAKNLVVVKYKRDSRIPPGPDEELALSDQIHTTEVTIERRVQASIDLLGERRLEINSDLLRAVGTTLGRPLTGDLADETGARVAERIAQMASDRLVLGGQYFVLEGRRSVADVEGLREGAWVTTSASWMPDYLSGERGLSRLAQIVSRRPRNAAWVEFVLLDAGSAAAPHTQPTLGTLTVDAAGVVSIPVSALGTGEARVDYAVASTEPAANSELWTFLDRVAALPETLVTPELPAGGTAWVRTRGEEAGRRPSAYTSAVSIAIPQTPRVADVAVKLNPDLTVRVEWTPNAYCGGVRIAYEVHPLATVPTFADDVEVDAGDVTATLPDLTVALGEMVSVIVTPFPTWTGSAVSGTAGPEVRADTGLVTTPDYSINAQLIPIPLPNGEFAFDISYDAGRDASYVIFDVQYSTPGPILVVYSKAEQIGGDALFRLKEIGGSDFVLEADETDLRIALRAAADSNGDVAGTPIHRHFEGPSATGAGVRAELTAGGERTAAKLVHGTGIEIDEDGSGNIRIVATGIGGGHALGDHTDVSIASPASLQVLGYDGGWGNVALTAAHIPNLSTDKLTSGVLPAIRGGTGRSTFNGAGRLLVSTSSTALTTLAASSAGGYVRSNGSTWVRVSGIAAADVVAGTLGVGNYIMPGRLSLQNAGFRETDFEATGFHEALVIGRNLRYAGSGDPSLVANVTYISAAGANSQAGALFFMKGNGGEAGVEFSFFTTPTSTGAGATPASLNKRFEINSAGVYIQDGTETLPGLAFIGEPASGFYRIGTGQIGVSIDEDLSVQFSSATLGIHTVSDANQVALNFWTNAAADRRWHVVARAESYATSAERQTLRLFYHDSTAFRFVGAFSWNGGYSQLRMAGGDGDSHPEYSFNDYISHGMRAVSSTKISFSVAGVRQVSIDNAGALRAAGDIISNTTA